MPDGNHNQGRAMQQSWNDDIEWAHGAVIYQIYPRSLLDTNGDGVGDLNGIAERLNVIADLGVDAIWISPFYPSPMKDFGYDISGFTNVDPIFGTLTDFDRIIEVAHNLGLKVIIDQVLSHSSDQHIWFEESRKNSDNAKSDWYVWADPKPDGTPPNNWQSHFGGPAWTWDPRRRQYYLHKFAAEQPDLNLHNSDVRDALLNVLEFWLDRGVDGFRFDAIDCFFHDQDLRDNPGVRPQGGDAATTILPYAYQDHVHDNVMPELLDYLGDIRKLLNKHKGVVGLGEIGPSPESLERMAAFTRGDRLHQCYTFDLLSPEFSASFISGVIERYGKIEGGGWPCWSFSNHDVSRHITRFTVKGADPSEIAKCTLALLCSLRGSMCIYQGEELGLPDGEIAFDDIVDPFGKALWPLVAGRDGCRTPYPWSSEKANAGFSTAEPWLPISKAQMDLAHDTQMADPNSILAAYRRLLTFRKRHPILRNGQIEYLPVEGPILPLIRSDADGKTLCVFNLSNEQVTWETMPGSQIQPLVGHGFSAMIDDETLVLPPWQCFFGQIG